MSALDTLKERINYNGGPMQEQRMNLDKLRSLKRALWYSYQAQTAVLEDDREFRCLINHDKLKEDYDDKIISIPYDDICLNAADLDLPVEEEQHIGMKVGDTFLWKETNTRWIIIQEILEENAYFRGTIRKAEDEVVINGHPYYGYLGKWSKDALWHTKGLNSWSEMGYEVVLYITKNEETENFFHRFQKVMISNRLWEVQMVNDITSETMLIIYLRETFTNEFEPVDNNNTIDDNNSQEENNNDENNELNIEPMIVGSDTVSPFDNASYIIENAGNGHWELSNTKARIVNETETSIDITIVTAKSGSIEIKYVRDNDILATKTVVIKSL